jgi:hypothetical protein
VPSASLCVNHQRFDTSIEVCLQVTDKCVAINADDLLSGNILAANFETHGLLHERVISRGAVRLKRFFELVQPWTELRPRVKQAHLHCRCRDAEKCSYLLLRVRADVEKHDDFSLWNGQRVNRGEHRVAKFFGEHDAKRILIDANLLRNFLERGKVRSYSTQAINVLRQDSAEPPREGRRVAQCRQLAVRGDERFLRGSLGEMPITKTCKGKANGHVLKGLDDGFIGFLTPRSDLQD